MFIWLRSPLGCLPPLDLVMIESVTLKRRGERGLVAWKSFSVVCWKNWRHLLDWCWLWITSLLENPEKLQLCLRISGAHINSSMQQQVKKEYCLIHAFTLPWPRTNYGERSPSMSMSIVLR